MQINSELKFFVFRKTKDFRRQIAAKEVKLIPEQVASAYGQSTTAGLISSRKIMKNAFIW